MLQLKIIQLSHDHVLAINFHDYSVNPFLLHFFFSNEGFSSMYAILMNPTYAHENVLSKGMTMHKFDLLQLNEEQSHGGFLLVHQLIPALLLVVLANH